MKQVVTLAVLSALFGPLRATAQPMRIFLGDSGHPVIRGEAWVIADRWGAYPAVLVARVKNGKMELRSDVGFPQYWEQAFDYKLLLAVSNRPVQTWKSVLEDFGYGTPEAPEYLQRFSIIYLSSPLPKQGGGRDWQTALRKMGGTTRRGLILPRPVQRVIRLLYPDGKPLSAVSVPVSLYGSNQNHCGVAVGIPLRVFTTSAKGEIFVVATDSPLSLARP
ncbi:MAG: hypothetical protein M1404_03035 [Acidobacteria bacterium]|nr:hypothetical protein [Acidobacteriota bacterium]